MTVNSTTEVDSSPKDLSLDSDSTMMSKTFIFFPKMATKKKKKGIVVALWHIYIHFDKELGWIQTLVQLEDS